jgi:biotin carboxylase
MKRLLIVAATTGYQTRSFESAARGMGLDVVLATDRCHQLEDPWGDNALPIRFEDPSAALKALSERRRPDAIVAVGDRPTLIAALAAKEFGLPYHSVEAVEVCRNKHAARERFRTAGLTAPDYFRVPITSEPGAIAGRATYPCVLKPLGLSGSRGVIRTDDELQFISAFQRIRKMLESPDIRKLQDAEDGFIQIETFIPGTEYALEGLVTGGELQVLAIFDKPEPLDGPFFEETLYVTPSRTMPEVIESIVATTSQAVKALGLSHGPVHAEMRYNDCGVWMLEVAARPIGGLCSQSLRFDHDRSLEHLVIRHALGEDVSNTRREPCASGVMMIPIPANGVYMGVQGVDEASVVDGITDIAITATEGQRLLKLPEGASYLGFIFGRADTADKVEAALKAAHKKLKFHIARELDVMLPGA